MNARLIPCLLALACWTAPLAADVLDDAKLSLKEFMEQPGAFGTSGADLAGIPLSPEHEAELLALPKEGGGQPGGSLFMLPAVLEARGNFQAALDLLTAEADLSRVRLLFRLGREAEAKAALSDEAVARLNQPPRGPVGGELLYACRPLEDTEQWDLLERYLIILRERLIAPAWQKTIWLEELDVAWHRGQLPQLLASAAGDKLRLCIYQDKLGYAAETERLAGELIAAADPARMSMAELVCLLPDCPSSGKAALALWMKPDLAAAERSRLWERLRYGSGSSEFKTLLPEWLRSGGDPTPFADLLAEHLRSSGNSSELPLLEELHRRLPDEPRFTFLLARLLVPSDEARAVDLFASLAKRPLQRDPKPDAYRSRSGGIANVSAEDLRDPALLGFLGLGSLDRQARVKQIIEVHADWPALPAWDQARLLAAARMDHDFVNLVLGADHSLPGNEFLTAQLCSVLQQTRYERVIPLEVYQRIAAKMPAMVIGTGKAGQVRGRASQFTNLLGDSPLGLDAVQAAINATQVAAKPLPEAVVTDVDRGIRDGARNQARLKAIYPPLDEAGQRNVLQDYSRLGMALCWVRQPGIQRLGNSYFGRSGMIDSMQRYRATGGKRYASLSSLKRWMSNGSEMFMPFPEEGDARFVLMKNFPAGHPRRIVADILVAGEYMRVPDEAVKAESIAAAEDLVSGKLSLPGTELFRYMTLALRGAKDEDLRPILEAVKSQPPALAKQFLASLGQDHESRAGLELAQEVLRSSEAEFRQAQQRPARDPDMAKLAELINDQLNGAPETLRLARVVLDKALDLELAAEPRNSQSLETSYNAGLRVDPAIRVLETAAQLDAWREAAIARQRQAGMPELRTLKVLRSFEQSRQRRQEEGARDFALKILALDPGDDEAASLLIDGAVSDGDGALLDRCIRALGLKAFNGSRAPALFARYANGREDALRILLEPLPVGRGQDVQEAAARVHGFFLGGQANVAAKFRGWLESRMDDKMPRQVLATQLLGAGDRDAAAALFVGRFTVLPVYSGAPWTFAPKPGTANVRRPYETPEKSEKDIPFLIESGLAASVVKAIDASGAVPNVDGLLLRLASRPDRATYDQHAVPYLAALGDMERRGTLNRLRYFFEEFEGASALNLRILEDLLTLEANEVSLASAADLAGKQLGGGPVLAKIWARVAAGLKEADESKQRRSAVEGRHMFSAMLVRADDATWAEYWKWRSSDEAPLPSLYNWPYPFTFPNTVAADRFRQVLPRIMSGPKDPESGGVPQVGWLGAALETGDPALMAQARALLPKEFAAYGALCDLAAGDPAAVSPLVGTYEEADGTNIVWWNLVALRRPSREEQAMDIPLVAFPKLDGKFDIRVLGGPQKDQLNELTKVPAAAAAGHVRLAPGVKPEHFGLLVTEAGGGAVRWSPTVQRGPQQGKRVEITEEQLAAKGFARMARSGPGGLPAWELKTGDGSAVDLAEIPWSGSGPVSCSAWVSGMGKFTLRCYDAAGKRVHEMFLLADIPAIPSWQLVQLKESSEDRPPPGTVRITLTAYSPYPDGLTEFAFSGLEFYAGGDVVLPDGFHKIGRVSGNPEALAVAPDGQHLAIALEGGRLAIMKVATGEVREGRLYPAPVESNPSNIPRVLRLVWMNDQTLVGVDSAGLMYRGSADELKFSALPLMDERRYLDQAVETSDKLWLMWRKDDTTFTALDLRPGGKLHAITIPIAHDIRQGPDGMRIRTSEGQRFLLKLAELPAGAPVELAEDAPPWENDGWLQDLVTSADQPGWQPVGDTTRLMIPAFRAHAKAPDNSFYYADPQGVVVKVSPPR